MAAPTFRRNVIVSLLGLALTGTLAAEAPDETQTLAAARAADLVFSRHLDLTYAALAEGDQAAKIAAIRTLGRQDVAEAVPVLLPYADFYHQPAPILIAACESLADLNAVAATGDLQKLLNHNDAAVRAAAQKALVRLESMSGPLYLQRGDDRDDALRASAVTSLGAMEAQDAGDLLVEALRFDGRPHIRRMAAIGLGRLGDPSRAPVLMDALSDADPGVRQRAAEALSRLNATQAIPYLLFALEANVSGASINRALMKLSGQDFGFDPRANALDRQLAIDKGFEWWSSNAKSLQGR